MNYKKIYENIIENRKNNIPEGYSEKHHIIPKSLGGSDDSKNIVKLTAREHFICHYLLVKINKNDELKYYKMLNAFTMMKCSSYNQNRYFNSKLYETLRSDFSKLQSLSQIGDKNTQFGTKWICNLKLQKNKKIKKEDNIPDGWILGRRLNWDIKKLDLICSICDKKFKSIKFKKCCSKACAHNKSKNSWWNDKEKTKIFIKSYKENKNISKSLRKIDIAEPTGTNYKHAKKIINAIQ